MIGLNKFAYINYSFCCRFMNNSVVVSWEWTGKGARGFATRDRVRGLFSGRCVVLCSGLPCAL